MAASTPPDDRTAPLNDPQPALPADVNDVKIELRDAPPADGNPTSSADGAPPRGSAKFQLIPDDEFEKRKPPEYLIEGILPVGAEVKLVGGSGVGKSFVAIEMAMAIAAGRLFLGKFAVKHGPVVYIVAEGAGGFPKRIRAWKVNRDVTGRAGVYLLDVAVQMDGREGGHVTELLKAIMALPEPPVVIVIDTQNRCTEGKDENSSKDMSAFLAAVSRLREETRAAVLTVHHTGWEGGRERGHSSQRGAADTVLLVEKGKEDATGGPIVLKCLKQKDDSEFDPITIKTKVVDLGKDDKGKEQSSLVLELADAATSAGSTASESRVDLDDPIQKRPEYFEHETHMAMVLLRQGPLPAAELRKAVADIPERTFYSMLKRLCEKREIVSKCGDEQYDLVASVRTFLEGISKQRLDYTYRNPRGGVGLVIRQADWTWYEAEAAA
jgi:hypothetical protein